MLITWPRSRATIPGSTARVTQSRPFTLVSSISSQSLGKPCRQAVEAAAQAGVVDQDVDLLPGGRQAGDGSLDRGAVADVELDDQGLGADAAANSAARCGEPVVPAGGEDQPVALAGEEHGRKRCPIPALAPVIMTVAEECMGSSSQRGQRRPPDLGWRVRFKYSYP